MACERVSACLIVQDEQERLGAALASVAFCDEVIVIDGGSSDRTVEVARAAGARVIENPWPGFALQRNLAIDAATGDWILEIDADERITPRLRASIQALLGDPPPGADMAVFALRNNFLGGPLGPSAKYPNYRSRLFRRGAYRHDESRAVHEGLQLRGRPVILAGDLEHELAGGVREALSDLWRYARLESGHLSAPSAPAAYLKGMVLRPVAKLGYRTVVDGGWRDGWRGIVKIGLDVASDVLVWALVLSGRGHHGPADTEQPHEHFGARRLGPRKVVALAGDGAPARAAAERLAELHADGADVTLICANPPTGWGLPLQRVARMAPLAAVRALETEMQVRPADGVIAFGRRARLALALVPAGLRPRLGELDGEEPLSSSG